MAFDAFLKLGDIKGESQNDKHKDEIQIESFHWGVANATSGSGGGGTSAGRASAQDFLFTAASSKASPELFIACATGEHIKEGLLTLSSAGESQTTFSTIKLFDVTVSGYDQAGDDDGGNPVDEFSLRYDKVEFTYNTVKATYDFQTGKKG